MRHSYRMLLWLWGLLTLAGAGTAARAQSGPYGNEWIVPGQPYYKLKTWRDGLYRLDYAYLSQLAGASGVAPSQLQLWRRGREVAVYQGGSATTLDASTFLEFYGQRNDGALDRDYYKSRFDQANPYYSYFTDTASYFITWGSRAGKRMAQPTATGGAPHAWRIQATTQLHTGFYSDAPDIQPNYTFYGTAVYQPWLNSGEGFFGGYNYNQNSSSKNDSLLRAVATTATTSPRVAIAIVGATNPTDGHHVQLSVVPPSGTARQLTQVDFANYDWRLVRFPLQFADISTGGQVEIRGLGLQPAVPIFSYWQYAYTRLWVPQQVVWFSDRRAVFFQNDSLLTGPATYDVPGVPGTVAGFDVHDPWNVQRVAPGTAATAGAARFVFPSATTAQTRNLLLADEARPLVPGPARRVSFRTIDPAAPNFVVVTHPKLQKPFGSSQNPARDYAAYRASVAGGRFDTLTVTTPLLIDQFHYGEQSVLAVRHFARWLGAGSPAAQAKYLLLLGKGITTGSNTGDSDYPGSYRGVSAGNTTRVQGSLGLDLVPTTSRAPSDVFFSNDWPNGNYVPRLATGRVIASTPEEVANYLDKLKNYEAALVAPSLDAWHKSVLNLAGGLDAPDIATFTNYLAHYEVQMEHPLYGASVELIQRPVAPGIAVVPLNISAQVNRGLQFINYFGHGSPTYINFGLGDINNSLSGYANAGKYPVMVVNGCAVGACFFVGRTFGGDWLLAPQKGSIGLLSETGFSFANFINAEQDTINHLMFNTPVWFGQPVAAIQRETVRRVQNTPSAFPADDPAAIAQLNCTIWHGDPALRIFAPAKPDLQTSSNALSLGPVAGGTAPVTATSAQFVLSAVVSNPARITRDSVEVRLTRTYTSATDGTTKRVVYLYYNHGGAAGPAFRQAFRRDTTYTFTLPQLVDATGDNTFLVELDYRNRINELDETNNTGTLRYSFLRSGLTVLAPREFAVANTTSPRLVAQSNNLNEPLRSYDVQIDSVSTFATPVQSFTKQANTVLSFTPPRPLVAAGGRDSVVWYWRVRFSAPGAGEDGSWVTSSFRIINNAVAGGWSQSHNGQFGRDQLSGVAVAAPSNRWSFATAGLPVLLRTSGGGLPGSASTFTTGGGTIQTSATQAPYLNNCGSALPNVLAVVLDANTLRRVAVPAPTGTSYLTCGANGQTFYAFGKLTTDYRDSTNNTLNDNAAYRAQLSTFLDNVPDGAYVLLVSQNRLRFASPDLAALRQKLATVLGSQLVSQLRNGDPWTIVARKQAGGGTVVAELGPDRASATPAYAQSIALNATVTRPGTSGTITSTLIGPAVEWRTLFNQIKNPNPTGSYTLALLGVDANGTETVLNPDVKVKNLSLSNISAATYPNLRLRLTLADTTTRVPPQLRQWLLTFRGKPEGVVRRDLVAAAAYDAATLTSQAKNTGYLRFPLKFDNVAPDAFTGRLQVQVSLYDANNNLAKYPDGSAVQALITAPRSLGANDSVLTLPASLLQLKVIGVFGTLTPVAVVNPQLPATATQPAVGQPEQYFFNNELRLPPITVTDTNVPPTLDVAVDGRHILNGELVSPTPVVVVQLKDEDRLRFVNNASYFSVYLQKDGQATPTKVTDPSLLRFSYDSTSQVGSVARLEYYPGKNGALENGKYTLSVQGRDPSSASAGTQQFSVQFEVVRASTITNVYPYPNPVTSKAKFVFTVTGQELPRNMKIQILTLTGRVVREIFMGELGPLHIGNNITDYAWDGTDQYGDRLANGTYLYRVLLDDDGKFTRRETAGDQAFKNDWGKLVLLR